MWKQKRIVLRFFFIFFICVFCVLLLCVLSIFNDQFLFPQWAIISYFKIAILGKIFFFSYICKWLAIWVN